MSRLSPRRRRPRRSWRAVLKQAAARAYPDLYRLLGGDPPSPAAPFVAQPHTCPACQTQDQPKPFDLEPPEYDQEKHR